MSRKEFLIMSSLYDAIFSKVLKKLKWRWDNNSRTFKDSDGYCIRWDDFDSVKLGNPVRSGVLTYNQINIWGDGTMEFQCELNSENWSKFSPKFLRQICNIV